MQFVVCAVHSSSSKQDALVCSGGLCQPCVHNMNFRPVQEYYFTSAKVLWMAM